MAADVIAISPANIIWATETEIFTKEILHVNVEIQGSLLFAVSVIVR